GGACYSISASYDNSNATAPAGTRRCVLSTITRILTGGPETHVEQVRSVFRRRTGAVLRHPVYDRPGCEDGRLHSEAGRRRDQEGLEGAVQTGRGPGQDARPGRRHEPDAHAQTG